VTSPGTRDASPLGAHRVGAQAPSRLCGRVSTWCHPPGHGAHALGEGRVCGARESGGFRRRTHAELRDFATALG
jgi:hypothetical protein